MKLRNKKTGEIADLAKRGLLKSDNDNHIIVYPDGTLRYYAYDSLAELCEEWEDYVPKEPLIKDERIRKAVRLCAGIWGANKILVIKSGSRIEFSDGTPNMRYASFMYAEWQDEIENRTYYTIDELCGEEEG